MRRYSIFISLILLLPSLVMAQNFADAYRLSYNQIQGTARSAGMGNAFGALGGDFSSLSINPAGSAIYQSNEFVITPGFYNNSSEMKVDGNTFSDNDPNFSLNNVGVVGSYKTNNTGTGIVNISYGFGYNRVANFNSSAFAKVDDSPDSWLYDITDYANTESLSNSYLNQYIGNVQYRDWPAKLAWSNYLINPVNNVDGSYESILGLGDLVNQSKNYIHSGRIDEYVLNFSMNFNHNFYIGTTVGIQDIKYKHHFTYNEDFGVGGDMIFKDNYRLDGTGYNVKIGAIYKPVQSVRLGLAFHTPTFFELQEESALNMQSSEQQEYVDPGVNQYNYDFNTPLKVIMSGAFVFSKKGLLSVDAEYIDYSTMRFRRGGNGDDNFSDVNSVMGDVFNPVFNVRFGGEYKLTPNFAVRAGYEMYNNPFKSPLVLDEQSTWTDNTTVLAGGFGYSANNFSLNVAYTNTLMNISDGNAQPNFYQVNRKNTNQNILLTLGFRFD
ncbi:MAG: outer membrane protein transport protein [Prolixibacteraceae bacterium]|nr:outer membrane protein transport protein [Prolixibacteraceae bacterium]